jgi:hypothetical protein
LKIRFTAFRFAVSGTGPTIVDFLQSLVGIGSKTADYKGYDRLHYLAQRGDYFLGLLVTIKDQRVFCQLIDEGSELKISVAELEANTHAMDFNYFAINATTGRGVYQHYHHSCAFTVFGSLCSTKYAQLAHQVGAKKAALTHEIIVRPEKLGELLDEMNEIKSFQFDVGTVTAVEPTFGPLGQYGKKRRHKISFDRGHVSQLRQQLKTFVRRTGGLEKARIVGKDADGAMRILDLDFNPMHLAQIDFDTAAREMSFDLAKFDRSALAGRVMQVVADHRQLLEIKVKDE